MAFITSSVKIVGIYHIVGDFVKKIMSTVKNKALNYKRCNPACHVATVEYGWDINPKLFS